MFTARLLLSALLMMALPTVALAELNLRVTFTEKQKRSRGMGSSNDTCRTTYAIKTLGRLMFIATRKSNCRTFRVGALQGADGSASALVFEGRNSRTTTRCTYRARNSTETCSDRTKVRLPDGPDEDYRADVKTATRYRIGPRKMTASRQVTRVTTTAQGTQLLTESTFDLAIAMDGSRCEVIEFSTDARRRVTKPGRGRAFRGPEQRESRRLVETRECKVISR